MQSCLYFSRLGKPFLQRSFRSSELSLSKPFELRHAAPNLRRFKHDAAQYGEKNDGPLIRYTNAEKGSNRARRPSLWRRPAAVGKTLGTRKHNCAGRKGDLHRVPRLTPPIALAEYLDLQDASQKKVYCERIKLRFRPSALPYILLHQLYTSSTPGIPWSSFDRSFHHEANKTLASRGYTRDDVAQWAWILSGDSTDDMIGRFLSTTSEKPQFLLLELLRRDILKVKTLKLVLIYVWERVNSRPPQLLPKTPEDESDASIPWSEPVHDFSSHLECPQEPFQMDNSFTILISRLLYQTRRIWPPAMVSVSHMAVPYIHSVLNSNNNPEGLDARTFSRLSKMVNYILRLLALPATIGPLRSMGHNWAAQKVLLELAGNVEPPLTLDQNSYRAVIQVLAASKKSEREARVATLRTRSWPPWRVDQDGMDAQRSLEEDFSRVISATARTKESGYREDAHDETMRVFGGMEPDGTPTIQSRKLIKRRGQGSLNLSFTEDHLHAGIWAARVEATRDIQEAWGAFAEFLRRGGKPNLALYMAMFQKLNYGNANSGRESPYDASPGDGREVLPVSNDNFTDYYRVRLQAPSLDSLYEQMTESGLRPSGRCLMFLVGHARTTDHGLRYLRDGGVDELAVAYLAGGSETRISPTVLERIPDDLFSAFIHLACRFAPRAILSSPNLEPASPDEVVFSGNTSEEMEEIDGVETTRRIGEQTTKKWTVVEMQPRKLKHLRFRNPLHHVAFLLKQRPTHFRPTWYALFQALAEPGVLISRNLLGDSKNDHLAWRVLSAALNDFHNCGLELDPAGFVIICQGFEKFATALSGSGEHREAILEGAKIIQAQFTRLSETQEEFREIPKLLHTISGVHLHAYVRALGVIEDYKGVLSALEWMIENSKELEAVATETRNGRALVKRTIVAIRVFLRGSEYEETAKELVEQVEWWDGWPPEAAVEEYLERGSGRNVTYEVRGPTN